MKHVFLGLLALVASACAAVPTSAGDPYLFSKPNLLFEPNPLFHIKQQLPSPFIPACNSLTTAQGPSSQISASTIEYTAYNQELRPAWVINYPVSFGAVISKGPYRGKFLQVTVPPGFVTDFHSVPIQWASQSSQLRMALAAAVIHDWMFAVGTPGELWKRDLANQMFDEILKHYRVNGFTRGAAQIGFERVGNRAFGDARELRIYNKCFYGVCDPSTIPTDRDFTKSPAMPMPSGGEYASLRKELWDLTVCIRDPAPTA